MDKVQLRRNVILRVEVDVVETRGNCRQWADGGTASHRPPLRDRSCYADRLDLPGLAGQVVRLGPRRSAHRNLEAQITT
jgi:hypothetical protein